MTGITAHRKGDGRGFWRIGWIAAINGREIAGIKFATRAKAIAYAKRVAQYQGPENQPNESTDDET